jgi:hypothetical protein
MTRILSPTGDDRNEKWDTPITLGLSDVLFIREQWEALLQNEWISFPPDIRRTPLTSRVIVISDASGQDGFGYRVTSALYDTLEDHMSSWESAFPDDIRKRNFHIFYKELHAACEGLKAAARHSPESRRFVLGCDNTGVIGTLRRGYSQPDAMSMLQDLYCTMPRDFDLSITYIPSNENLADDLSHLRNVSHALETTTYRRLKLAERGLNGARVSYPKGSRCARQWRRRGDSLVSG